MDRGVDKDSAVAAKPKVSNSIGFSLVGLLGYKATNNLLVAANQWKAVAHRKRKKGLLAGSGHHFGGVLHVFGMKGELKNGYVGVFVHNVGDVLAHHTGGAIMHDGPPHLDTTNSDGGLENICSTCGLSCDGFKSTTNRG